MGKLPNFMIVGAPRSGTTSLYHYLKQHPQIAFPVLKEPKYFSSIHQDFPHRGPGDKNVDCFAIRDFDRYKRLFERLKDAERIGEASPDTLYCHRHTAATIRDTLGDVDIVMILRAPSARAFSAYSYLVRDNREQEEFRTALDLEETRIADNWDFLWAYKSVGLYSGQVATFMEKFSRVKIVLFDDLVSAPGRVVRDLLRFLGVDDECPLRVGRAHNQSGVPANALARLVLNRRNPGSVFLRETLKLLVPRRWLESVSVGLMKRQHLSTADETYLKSYFRSDITRLEEHTGRDLSAWM